MKTSRALFLLLALPFLGLSAQPVQAKAQTRAQKKVAELRKKQGNGRNPNHAGRYHDWAISVGASYDWTAMDSDASPHWLLEAQRRVSTYGVVALGVNQGSHEINNRPGADQNIFDVNLSYIQYVHENTLNRQPNFYYGAGLNYLQTSVSTRGSEGDIGFHVRAGVEFKHGIFSELRYTYGPSVSRWNGAKTGHISLMGGYKFGL